MSKHHHLGDLMPDDADLDRMAVVHKATKDLTIDDLQDEIDYRREVSRIETERLHKHERLGKVLSTRPMGGLETRV